MVVNSPDGVLGKKKKKEVDWKRRFMDWMQAQIPGGKKVEDAMKDRTGGKSQKEKQFPEIK